MKHDYKLVLDGWDGTFKIAIPIAFNQPQKTTKEKVISLDPGIRTPWVGYDPGGEIIEFSPHLRPEIQRLHRGVDSTKRHLHMLQKGGDNRRKVVQARNAI